MDTKEYNEAVKAYSDNIYRFVLKHAKNSMLADDIVQETFVKVWEKKETIQADKIKSYLFTTAYHALVDTMKKENRSASMEEYNAPATNDRMNEFDIQKALNEALDRLPEVQKSAILLRDYEGYSYEEIAEILSLTESQVKVYIFRGRQALKNYLVAIENVV